LNLKRTLKQLLADLTLDKLILQEECLQKGSEAHPQARAGAIFAKYKYPVACCGSFIESFNGRLRDECLNVYQFTSLAEAQHIIETWRFDDNQGHPHSSLGHLTPNEFVGQRQVIWAAEEAFCSS
jgi:integrase-like protein